MQRRLPLALPALIAILMLPNVARFFWEHSLATWITGLVIPIFLLAAWFAIWGKRLWIACLTLAPVAALAPAELFYVLKYHHPSTYNVLGTVVATNFSETLQYFGWAALLLVPAILASFSLSLVAARQCRLRRSQWSGRVRGYLLLMIIGLPIAIFAMGAIGNKPDGTSPLARGWSNVRSMANPIETGYPFGVALRVQKFLQDWYFVYTSAAELKNFQFHASLASNLPQRQIYVLVIGESSARAHWQLFGYDRPTNPELSTLPNIIPVSDMLTSYAATQEAIPIMLTRKPVTSFDTLSSEASILKATSEAGYQTWWISNQVALGKYESQVAIYSLEANHVLYLNSSAWTTDSTYDEDLLEPLKNIITNGKGNEFIVLHMMGSHIKYDLRYPASFAFFKPTQSDVRPESATDPREINSYDNTIRYTDHVLAQVIDLLKDSQAVSALWYESDHGETLAHDQCGYSGHGFGTRDEFQVPTIFWYSDAYGQRFPERIENLLGNSSKRSISANTFESLSDMTGISFPTHDASMSLFSTQWRYRPRIVHSLWELDYDKATLSADCQLVMPERDDHHE